MYRVLRKSYYFMFSNPNTETTMTTLITIHWNKFFFLKFQWLLEIFSMGRKSHITGKVGLKERLGTTNLWTMYWEQGWRSQPITTLPTHPLFFQINLPLEWGCTPCKYHLCILPGLQLHQYHSCREQEIYVTENYWYHTRLCKQQIIQCKRNSVLWPSVNHTSYKM